MICAPCTKDIHWHCDGEITIGVEGQVADCGCICGQGKPCPCCDEYVCGCALGESYDYCRETGYRDGGVCFTHRRSID